MSVIVRHPDTGTITLYCKGADTIMFERLHPDCKDLMDTTLTHLGVSGRVLVGGVTTPLHVGVRKRGIEDFGVGQEGYCTEGLRGVVT